MDTTALPQLCTHLPKSGEILKIFNRRFPEVITVTLYVFCENPKGFLFLLVCFFVCLFINRRFPLGLHSNIIFVFFENLGGFLIFARLFVCLFICLFLLAIALEQKVI